MSLTSVSCSKPYSRWYIPEIGIKAHFGLSVNVFQLHLNQLDNYTHSLNLNK